MAECYMYIIINIRLDTLYVNLQWHLVHDESWCLIPWFLFVCSDVVMSFSS